MKTRSNLASRHDDRGFRGPGAPASCRHCKLASPTMGIVPTFPNDTEKGLSVVRLQVAKTDWAYAPCTMPHTSEPYIRSQFSPTATTTPAK